MNRTLTAAVSLWCVGLLCLSPQAVAAEGRIDLGVGMFTASSAAELRAGVSQSFDVLELDADLGLVGRNPEAWSVDSPIALAGTLKAGPSFKINDRTHLGVKVILDHAVLPADEAECAGQSSSCRHANFITLGEAGVSYQGAGAIEWRKELRGTGHFVGSLGIQPVLFYGQYIPIVPRAEAIWTVQDGWRIGARGNRYEAIVLMGRTIGG